MADQPYIPPGASPREVQIRQRVHAQAEFYRHLMIYVGVISLLWVINLMQVGWPTEGTRLWRYWAIWPTLGWGIGITVHGISALSGFGMLSQEWEERKVKELMQQGRE